MARQHAEDAAARPNTDDHLTAARVLQALHQIALSIADASDVFAMAELVARTARTLLHGDDSVLYIWDEDASALRLAYGENTGHVLRPLMRAGEGAVGRAFSFGKPVVVTDYPNWEGAIPELVARRVKRVAAVPLKVDSRILGVLAVRFLGARGCTPSHVRALQLLAAPVGAMLEVAQARQRAEAGEARLAAILDHLPSGVLVRGPTGQVILMNETARQMVDGAVTMQLLGLDQIDQLEVYDALSQARLGPQELPTARALRGEAVVDGELRVTVPGSDRETWIRISAVPLRGSDESILAAVAIFTDVSRERDLVRNLHTSARENSRLLAELEAAQRRHAELLASLRPAESESSAGTDGAPRLSAREFEVLAGIGRGQTNREIGRALGLSPGTVKKHVEHILRKLGVADRTHAAVRAAEMGVGSSSRVMHL